MYRVDGEYRLKDSERLRRGDDDVVRAAHVSVVDMRWSTWASSSCRSRRRDAAELAVHVTRRTVTDAVAVTSAIGVDAHMALRSYLSSHSRIFQLRAWAMRSRT